MKGEVKGNARGSNILQFPGIAIIFHPSDLGPWTLDLGLWTLDLGLWTLDLILHTSPFRFHPSTFLLEPPCEEQSHIVHRFR